MVDGTAAVPTRPSAVPWGRPRRPRPEDRHHGCEPPDPEHSREKGAAVAAETVRAALDHGR